MAKWRSSYASCLRRGRARARVRGWSRLRRRRFARAAGDGRQRIDGAVGDADLSDAPAGEASSAAPPADAGSPAASLSAKAIDFGPGGCGAPGTTQTLSITAAGSAPLVVSATTSGAAFSVTPTSLSLGEGGIGALTISATVPGSASAGTAITASLNLFTNDPNNTSIAIPLSVLPTGATLAFAPGGPSSVSFPTTEVGTAAPPAPFTLVNTGNAAGTFAFGVPTPALFLLPLAASTYLIDAGASLGLTADFTPSNSALATASAAITATGDICGQSLAAIAFSGEGATGQITGYPTAPVDFGPVPCGNTPPASRSFTLTNTGAVIAHITQAALTGAPGFTTSAAKGRYILPERGRSFDRRLRAGDNRLRVAVPYFCLTDHSNRRRPAPHTVNLVAEPSGALLAFDTSATPSFGDFGSVLLLSSATQSFGIVNTGNAPADVALVVTSPAMDGGSTGPFSVTNSAITLPAAGPRAIQSSSRRRRPPPRPRASPCRPRAPCALRSPPHSRSRAPEPAAARWCPRARFNSPRRAAAPRRPCRRSPFSTRGART